MYRFEQRSLDSKRSCPDLELITEGGLDSGQPRQHRGLSYIENRLWLKIKGNGRRKDDNTMAAVQPSMRDPVDPLFRVAIR